MEHIYSKLDKLALIFECFGAHKRRYHCYIIKFFTSIIICGLILEFQS